MEMYEIAQVHSVDEKWQCWWGQILCGSSLWTIDRFMAKTCNCFPATVGTMEWRIPFERQLVACYWTLIETAPMTAVQKQS